MLLAESCKIYHKLCNCFEQYKIFFFLFEVKFLIDLNLGSEAVNFTAREKIQQLVCVGDYKLFFFI